MFEFTNKVTVTHFEKILFAVYSSFKITGTKKKSLERSGGAIILWIMQLDIPLNYKLVFFSLMKFKSKIIIKQIISITLT